MVFTQHPGLSVFRMSVFFQSFSLVAIAEIGDKTQLLSFLLAARFKSFFPICLGILVATLANHGLAAYAGSMLLHVISLAWLEKITAVLFILIGLWVLVPDKEPEMAHKEEKFGAFITTVIAFFLAEMGDKTQFATVTLGAAYHDALMVTIGTTAGMLAANIPAVLMGDKLLAIIPLKTVRIVASGLFIMAGLFTLVVTQW